MIEEILKKCTVKGLVVYLPEGTLDRKTYSAVAQRLNLIGGQWKGGKVGGFVFKEDPTKLLADIQGGEKRNIKKEFQFFGTPKKLADTLVRLANPISEEDILEPSAGQGAIVNSINEYSDASEVFCYELMPLNQTLLQKIPSVTLLGEDFLLAPEEQTYDCIIANPPFSKNQDIDHIYKMYTVLSANGRIVTMCSKHFMISSNKKETKFKNWLIEVGAEVHEVEAGEFKESGTNIATVILVIKKQ